MRALDGLGGPWYGVGWSGAAGGSLGWFLEGEGLRGSVGSCGCDVPGQGELSSSGSGEKIARWR